MEATFALPDQLRYDRAVPSDLGTETEIAVVTPYTGSAEMTIQAGKYFIINIPKSGNNALFDPMNSFLRFKLTFKNPNPTAGQTMAITLGGSADCILRRLEVYQGSNVLEQIDQYNNLSAMLMNSQISPIERAYQWSVLKGTNTTLGTKTGLSTGTMNPNNAPTVLH